MTALQWFNAGEAALWFGLAATVLWRYRQVTRPQAAIARCSAALLLLFGVSDVIEVQTGAWWRPWWLLGLKAFCVVGLATCAVLAWRRRQNHPEQK